MSYHYLEHTADIGIYVEAENFESALVDSINALIELIFGASFKENEVEGDYETLSIQSTDRESLLVDLLNEILYLIDSKKIIPLKPEINIDSNLKADLKYKPLEFDFDRHPIHLYVKAVTFHQLEIIEESTKIIIKFFVDI